MGALEKQLKERLRKAAHDFPRNRIDPWMDPDWRGNCMVNGVVMEIAAWTKTTSKGTEMLSLKFSLPREREDAPAAPAKQANHRPLPDTDIPF
jgi:hypothetical protein